MGLASKRLAGSLQGSKQSAGDARELSSHAGFADIANLQISILNENVKYNLQPSSSCHFEQNGTRGRGRGEDVSFSGQPLSSRHTDQCLGVSRLHMVPDTTSQSVAPAVEVVIHAPPTEVHPTGSLWPALFRVCAPVWVLYLWFATGLLCLPMFMVPRTRTWSWVEMIWPLWNIT